MNNVTKRAGIIGGAAAAVGLAIGGFALPANAATPGQDGWTSSSDSSTTSSTSRTAVDPSTLDGLSIADIIRNVGVNPETGSLIDGPVVEGPVVRDVGSGNTVGDVASGNPIASGNETDGNAVGSGNDTPVASGNETGNGNDTATGNETGNGNDVPVGSGNETSTGSGNDTSAPVGSGNSADTSLKDLGANVSDSVKSTVDDALTGTSDLGAVLGR